MAIRHPVDSMQAATSIKQITAGDSALHCQLGSLLRDAVEGGASVGYVLPVPEVDIDQYWHGVFADVQQGTLILLVAEQAGQVIGSAQLSLCMKPNGKHRAEVQKVLVHRSARRRGVGRDLLHALEHKAAEFGRNLLVLDTESDSGGQRLYAATGYQVAGSIPHFALSTVADKNICHVATTFMYKLL